MIVVAKHWTFVGFEPRIALRAVLLFVGLGLLQSCAKITSAPAIVQDEAAQITFVEVELTTDRIIEANRSPFTPKSLPAEFYGATPEAHVRALAKPPVEAAEPYLLGLGDIVTINGNSQPLAEAKFGLQLIPGSFQIREEGQIQIPGIGKLNLGGLTLDQANTTLTEFLIQRKIDPVYSVEIESFEARSVLVQGSVRSPGIVPVSLVPLKLDRALATRGGIRGDELASATVTLFRDGARYALRADEIGAMSEVILHDGDSIVVTAGQSAAELSTQYRNRAEFDAVPRDRVYIAGEVSSPRMMNMPFNRDMVLSELILDDGGIPLVSGDLSQVYVIRTFNVADGAVIYHLNAMNLVNLALAATLELRPQDIVYVAERPVTRWARFFSQTKPISVAAIVNTVAK